MSRLPLLDMHHVLQVIRSFLRIPATEMAACTGLTVDEYIQLERLAPLVPNENWNRLLATMAIVDAVLQHGSRPQPGSVQATILDRIHELERLDLPSRAIELDRLALELTWLDGGGP